MNLAKRRELCLILLHDIVNSISAVYTSLHLMKKPVLILTLIVMLRSQLNSIHPSALANATCRMHIELSSNYIAADLFGHPIQYDTVLVQVLT